MTDDLPPFIPSTLAISGGNLPGAHLAPGATGSFQPHSARWVTLTVDLDLLNLPRVLDHMEATLHANLIRRLAEAAGEIITRARRKLHPKPLDVVTPDGNIYGFDTGKMHDTLTSVLFEMTEGVTKGVFYDILSEQAEYWFWVEFGHMLRNGDWWPGYHFIGSTIVESEGMIRSAVREAIHDTFIATAATARAI